MKLRRMRLADLPEVMELSAASLPAPWSEGVWRGELESPSGCNLVMEKGGAIIGQIGVKHTADELHITTIAVHPDHRRRGCGRALLEAALAEFSGVRRVYLEVRPSNTGARAFYASLGFREVGRRLRYYGDEDALLMALDLRAPGSSGVSFSPRGGAAGSPGSRRA